MSCSRWQEVYAVTSERREDRFRKVLELPDLPIPEKLEHSGANFRNIPGLHLLQEALPRVGQLREGSSSVGRVRTARQEAPILKSADDS